MVAQTALVVRVCSKSFLTGFACHIPFNLLLFLSFVQRRIILFGAIRGAIQCKALGAPIELILASCATFFCYEIALTLSRRKVDVCEFLSILLFSSSLFFVLGTGILNAECNKGHDTA